MPTTLLLAHPDLKTQRQLCKDIDFMGFRALPEVHHGCHVYDDAEIHSIYTYQDNKLLVPAVCFA